MTKVESRQPVLGLRIVEARSDDADIIVPLLDAYRQGLDAPSDPAAAHRFISERLEQKQSIIYFAIGKMNGLEHAVGFAQLYPLYSTMALRRVWDLHDLFVIPEARRGGIGRALIEHARQFAISTGATGLVLSTSHVDEPHHELLRSAGFIRDDEFMHYFLPV